jgi:hypothetical protein
MMHCNQLSDEKRAQILPQSDFLADKLFDLGLKVRRYADSHYNFYLIASLLHWELCLLDQNNIQPWIDEFPDLVRFANLYAKDNGLKQINITPGNPGV